MKNTVYLDWNASAPVLPAVAAAVGAALAQVGNASSVHRYGRLARRAVETAREQVAALVNARPEQVVFTGGGTEANNLALLGPAYGRVVTSAIEHASVLSARDGARVPATAAGVVDLDRLRAALADGPGDAAGPTAVAVMLANNETGVLQPLDEVVALARAAGAAVHCDAVQAAGRVAVDMAALDVDTVALSAHKIGGPMGVGALIVRDPDTIAAPLVRGGGQERGHRAGTENVPAIVGFGVAAEAAAASLPAMDRVRALRDAMEARIRDIASDAVVYGAASPRVPNTSLIGSPGLASDLQVMRLDLAGIAVSAGAACSSGKVAPSHVLAAMGVDPDAADTAIRVSIGPPTSEDDIDRFLAAWSRMRADATANAATAAATAAASSAA